MCLCIALVQYKASQTTCTLVQSVRLRASWKQYNNEKPDLMLDDPIIFFFFLHSRYFGHSAKRTKRHGGWNLTSFETGMHRRCRCGRPCYKESNISEYLDPRISNEEKNFTAPILLNILIKIIPENSDFVKNKKILWKLSYRNSQFLSFLNTISIARLDFEHFQALFDIAKCNDVLPTAAC